MARNKYSTVEEVDASDIQFGFGFKADPQKVAFAEDITLRLEQTNKSMAIRYLFNDKKTAQAYRRYATHYFLKHLGAGMVATRILPSEDGKFWVYFKNR